MEEQDFEMMKIVLIGRGKSKIVSWLAKSTGKATIGVEFLNKYYTFDGKKVKVTIWDTALHQRYLSLSKMYFKGCDAIIFTYDASDNTTFEELEKWISIAKQNLNQQYKLNVKGLFAMNSSIESIVPSINGINYCKNNKLSFYEVMSDNFEQSLSKLFNNFVQKTYNNRIKQLQQTNIEIDFDD